MADLSTQASLPDGADDSAAAAHGPHGHDEKAVLKLAVGAIGIVFGDIGTSPLYAFRETFAGHHKLTMDPEHILGVISLMFWSMMLVVTLKYVTIIMRADNKGEGGSLALLARISGRTKTQRWRSEERRGGKESGSTCRARWAQYHEKTKKSENRK